MEYYGNNDWRDYKALSHHGVLGMKWGVRRYQPYSQVPRGSGKKGREVGEASRVDDKIRKYKKKITSNNDKISKSQAKLNSDKARKRDEKVAKLQYKIDKHSANTAGKIAYYDAHKAIGNHLESKKQKADKKNAKERYNIEKLENKNRKLESKVASLENKKKAGSISYESSTKTSLKPEDAGLLDKKTLRKLEKMHSRTEKQGNKASDLGAKAIASVGKDKEKYTKKSSKAMKKYVEGIYAEKDYKDKQTIKNLNKSLDSYNKSYNKGSKDQTNSKKRDKVIRDYLSYYTKANSAISSINGDPSSKYKVEYDYKRDKYRLKKR